MASFTDILNKLFSRTVVIKRLPGDRLKAIDVNHDQSIGNKNMYYPKTKWRNTRMGVNSSGYGTNYTQEEVEAARLRMYMDYELMDQDALISSALDIVADECTTNSETGELLVIKTNDENIRKILHNLFYDIMNIEFNLWSYVRTTLKYGDFMLYLDIREGLGIVNVMPIHPAVIQRQEGTKDSETEVVFNFQGEGSYYSSSNKINASQVAHFRLMSDTNYLPYGKSFIEGSRKVYKQLLLMEDAMLLHRIMRSPEKRVFKIDIGAISPDEVDSHIENIVSSMKKVPYIDEATGDYNLKFNLQNMMEDFYLPVRGADSGTSIEPLGGLSNDGQMDDIEYFKSKLVATLKIPKIYLNFDDVSGGGTDKGTLAQQDVRFARTIERIQKIIVSELYKIAVTHLYVHGYKDEELLDFELTLTSPSIIYERQKVDLLNEKFTLITNILETNLLSDEYIYENILNMSQDQWQLEKTKVIEFNKNRFRLEQIKTEGNDPEVTNRSFGTPHDIAAMHTASGGNSEEASDTIKKMYAVDDRHDNEGRPEKFGTFERPNKDKINGGDPVGRKELNPNKISAESYQKQLDKFFKPIKGTATNSLLNEELLLPDEL